MLIAHAERAGVWTVDGGMQRLADALAVLAGRAGVRMHFDAEVRELVVPDGRIAGVVLADGEPIPADAVVFAGDTEALSRGLLGSAARRALPARRAGPRSLSAITWSLQARPAGFPLLHHTVFFGRDYEAEFAALFDQATICESPTVYVCAQDQSEHAPVSPAAAQRLFLLVNAPPRTFDDAELAAVTARVGRVLGDQGLDLKLDDTAVRTTTPADFDALCPASDGALYGWPTHGWNAAFRRPGARARIPGLYLAGGTVHPGPGVPMTALSGRLAAAAVRRDLGLG
jgi:1-hydroxycarotenoid 3,4-desaturase